MIDCIKEWQTLLTGLMALIAAGGTICVLWTQIGVQKDQFDQQLSRKKRAWKARMPIALSAICKYTSEVAHYLLNEDVPPPSQPDAAMDILMTAMEYQEEKATERTADLASHYQVHNARLGADEKPTQKSDWEEIDFAQKLYDLAKLRAYATSLFDYARGDSDEGPSQPPAKEDLETALNNSIGLINLDWESPVYKLTLDLIKENSAKQAPPSK